MTSHFIVFNAGSSSLKFSLFDTNTLSMCYHGQIEDITRNPLFSIYDRQNQLIYKQDQCSPGHSSAVNLLCNWLSTHSPTLTIKAIGHRVVHGGTLFVAPTLLSSSMIPKLKTLIPLAPLHQPHNIAVIEQMISLYPDLPQLACFDTAFHQTQSQEARLFALPLSYAKEGIIRYGFHGLSYEYIASVLPDHIGEKAHQRVIIAHLGNGASMCALHHLKSVSTTMSFTALDGLMMGSRCGTIDPGVILYLLQEKHMSAEHISQLLYKESGLKGVSGFSHDMRDLLQSNSPNAKLAIDLFCHQAAKQLAGLLPDLGGLDALIFTAGIGENCASIRQNICNRLQWLGIKLNPDANLAHKTIISHPDSHVDICVIATHEETTIAHHIKTLIASKRK